MSIIQILERRLSQVYADSRDEVSRHYRSLYQADAIEPSIQLSGGQLHSDLTRLISHDSRIKPTKERTLETTLVNYLYRAATKPSPFGRFVEVGAFDPSQPNSEPRRCSESSVTTNRILTSWLTAVTAHSFAAPEMLAILNSALRVKRDMNPVHWNSTWGVARCTEHSRGAPANYPQARRYDVCS
ncbi:lantibiotic dehydratase [Cutibacterium acnes]|jgi:hypothetical protein